MASKPAAASFADGRLAAAGLCICQVPWLLGSVAARFCSYWILWLLDLGAIWFGGCHVKVVMDCVALVFAADRFAADRFYCCQVLWLPGSTAAMFCG